MSSSVRQTGGADEGGSCGRLFPNPVGDLMLLSNASKLSLLSSKENTTLVKSEIFFFLSVILSSKKYAPLAHTHTHTNLPPKYTHFAQVLASLKSLTHLFISINMLNVPSHFFPCMLCRLPPLFTLPGSFVCTCVSLCVYRGSEPSRKTEILECVICF